VNCFAATGMQKATDFDFRVLVTTNICCNINNPWSIKNKPTAKIPLHKMQ